MFLILKSRSRGDVSKVRVFRYLFQEEGVSRVLKRTVQFPTLTQVSISNRDDNRVNHEDDFRVRLSNINYWLCAFLTHKRRLCDLKKKTWCHVTFVT